MAEKDQACSSASSCSRESCEGCPSRGGEQASFLVEQNAGSNIRHVIGIVSGKGGVGKSLVTASLANALAGTGDVPLTVFQSLPVDGIFIVTSPQDLVQMIVTKALNMAKAMNIPVLGVIENYSYLRCPDCGKQIDVFGKSRIEDIAGIAGLAVAGRIPIEPEYSEKADEGRFAEVDNEYIRGALDCIRRIKG